MKIISTDERGPEYSSEFVVAENITEKKLADVMCDALNDRGHLHNRIHKSRLYLVVHEGYQLRTVRSKPQEVT